MNQDADKKPEMYLGEEKYIKNIVKILKQDDINATPILIKGAWGTGKTYFCKQIIEYIKDDISTNPDSSFIEPVYVDMFSEEHLNKPLLSILGKLIASNTSERSFITHTIEKLSSPSLMSLIPTTIDLATGSSLGTQAANMLNTYIEGQDDLDKIREKLSDVCSDKNLILIIDELDRCNPNYALSTLETLKHIFEIKNLKILICANYNQLAKVVDNSYGAGTTTEQYLEKFFRYSFSINFKINSKTYRPIEYASKILKNSEIFIQFEQTRRNNFEFLILGIIDANKLSFRETEKFITKFFMSHTIMTDEEKNYPVLITYVILVCFISFLPDIDLNILNDKTLIRDLLKKSNIAIQSATNSPFRARLIDHEYLIHNNNDGTDTEFFAKALQYVNFGNE